MKAFTIDADKNIIAYDSQKEAKAAIDAGEGGTIFSSQDQLNTLTASVPMSALIEIFNEFSGVTLVKKFTSRTVAITRIWRECQKLAGAEQEPAEAAEPETPFDEPVAEQEPEATPKQDKAKTVKEPKVRAQKAPKAAKPAKATKQPTAAKEPAGAPRPGSKTAQVIEMLKRKNGAELEEIMAKFGWLQHTARSLLSAGGSITKKFGIAILSEKVGDKRVYRIAA
jgi:hypothetical protein